MAKPKPNRPSLLETVPDQTEAAAVVRWIDSPNSSKTDLEIDPALPPVTTASALSREASHLPVPILRRSHLTRRHLAISLGSSLVIGLLVLYVGWRFYLDEIAPKLASAAPVQLAATAAVAAPAPSDSVTPDLAKALGEMAALQKQVDVMRREQLIMQQNLRESLERVVSTPAPAPAPATVESPAGQPGVPRMAEMRLDLSPTQQEFIQLKERNRLTAYADEAIATGMRQPLELIVEYLRDPESKHLHEAAQAEYMRAVRAIQLLQRDDPGYRLPVAALFKDKTIRDEADVKPAALLQLLADHQQPWEVRVRTCFLLLGSPLPETNARLIKAIKDDPSLEVAKHAQLALEQRIKKRFRIFDIPAIEEWARTQEK